LSRKEVGIDIEEIKEYKESLAEYICNEQELNLLHCSDNQADEFYKLWTRKEAVFKKLGSGITKDIKNVLNNNVVIDSYRLGDIWLSVSYDK
jgi:4'-phosphopantetheinyl transferase